LKAKIAEQSLQLQTSRKVADKNEKNIDELQNKNRELSSKITQLEHQIESAE